MFQYQVIGAPKPIISWMRDGVPLTADASYLEPGEGFLKASGLIKSDAGMYQVFARNSAGESQAAAELIIQAGESISFHCPCSISLKSFEKIDFLCSLEPRSFCKLTHLCPP